MTLRGKDRPSSRAPPGEAKSCAVLPTAGGSQLWRLKVPLPLPQFTSDCSRGVCLRERVGRKAA